MSLERAWYVCMCRMYVSMMLLHTSKYLLQPRPTYLSQFLLPLSAPSYYPSIYLSTLLPHMSVGTSNALGEGVEGEGCHHTQVVPDCTQHTGPLMMMMMMMIEEEEQQQHTHQQQQQQQHHHSHR